MTNVCLVLQQNTWSVRYNVQNARDTGQCQIHHRALQYVFFKALSIIPGHRRNKCTILEQSSGSPRSLTACRNMQSDALELHQQSDDVCMYVGTHVQSSVGYTHLLSGDCGFGLHSFLQLFQLQTARQQTARPTDRQSPAAPPPRLQLHLSTKTSSQRHQTNPVIKLTH